MPHGLIDGAAAARYLVGAGAGNLCRTWSASSHDHTNALLAFTGNTLDRHYDTVVRDENWGR